MLFDVSPILYAPGKHLDFQFELNLSGLEFSGRYPVCQPVAVTGTVRNRAGILTLDLSASTVLDAQCDRCGKFFPLEKTVDWNCTLTDELQNEDQDEFVLLEDGRVDVEDLARTAFILSMDTKTLCSEECKGLCPRCGADLNLGPCACVPEPDARWAALAALLDAPGTEDETQ